MTDDRVTLNSDSGWTGPEYAADMLDEIVLSDASIHFEMSGDTSGYMTITSPTRMLFVRFHARPTTRKERRQILACNQDTLRDHLAALIPRWLGGRSVWSVPIWRRPASAVTDWWACRQAAGAVFCADLEEDEKTP